MAGRPKASKLLTAKEIINKMIKVLDRSIWTDETEGLKREPLGRSDTYWMRNTLKSMIDCGMITNSKT